MDSQHTPLPGCTSPWVQGALQLVPLCSVNQLAKQRWGPLHCRIRFMRWKRQCIQQFMYRALPHVISQCYLDSYSMHFKRGFPGKLSLPRTGTITPAMVLQTCLQAVQHLCCLPSLHCTCLVVNCVGSDPTQRTGNITGITPVTCSVTDSHLSSGPSCFRQPSSQQSTSVTYMLSQGLLRQSPMALGSSLQGDRSHTKWKELPT